MKGDPKVIDFLNEVLRNELTAINQYWLHYRLFDHWGVYKLAEFERHESIDEMKHADWLAERILFLDGLPNFQLLGRLRIGVSRPDSTDPEIVSAWVLGRFSEPPSEVAKLVSDSADLVEAIVEGRQELPLHAGGGQRKR